MKNLFTLSLIMSALMLSAQVQNSFKAGDGTNLYYTSYGKGSKVVVLYGGPGYGCKTIYSWNTILKNHQCIFFDQRGTGLSKNVKMDTSTINLRVAIEDIECLRKHLKEEKLVIIAYSWGAALAMAYAARFPDRVKNMVLISPIGPDLSFGSKMKDNILKRRTYEENDSLAYWLRKDVIAKDEVFAYKMQTYYNYIPYFFNHKTGGKLLWELINNADYNPVMANLMWEDLYKTKFDIKTDLKKFHGKCTIIRGLHDVIDYKVVVQIMQCLPQTVVNEIIGSGHFVELENPADFKVYLTKALK